MRSLRRYFLGVTYVAAFNAVVVGLAALILDVPLAGTIAVVVFVAAYVPFIGAFVSGAFAVILALSSQGTQTALIMLVVVILANGLLQNIVQPIAFGATLDLNPLVVLVVTIGLRVRSLGWSAWSSPLRSPRPRCTSAANWRRRRPWRRPPRRSDHRPGRSPPRPSESLVRSAIARRRLAEKQAADHEPNTTSTSVSRPPSHTRNRSRADAVRAGAAR